MTFSEFPNGCWREQRWKKSEKYSSIGKCYCTWYFSYWLVDFHNDEPRASLEKAIGTYRNIMGNSILMYTNSIPTGSTFPGRHQANMACQTDLSIPQPLFGFTVRVSHREGQLFFYATPRYQRYPSVVDVDFVEEAYF